MLDNSSYEQLWICADFVFKTVKIGLSRNCEATNGMPTFREGVLNVRKPREDKDYHTW